MTHHAMKRFRATKTPIARYLFLRDLQLFNPKVYFPKKMTRTEEILPFIYTPTGEHCLLVAATLLQLTPLLVAHPGWGMGSTVPPHPHPVVLCCAPQWARPARRTTSCPC